MKKQKTLDGTNKDAVENVEDSDETKKDVVEIKVDQRGDEQERGGRRQCLPRRCQEGQEGEEASQAHE